MSETDGGLRPLFRTNLPDIHWQSVETSLTGGGCPDSNFCKNGREGWIEFKKADAWAVTLRPAQVGWLSQRWRAGGRVFVGIRRINVASAADELWIIDGGAAAELKRLGLKFADELRTPTGADALLFRSVGKSRWDWSAVREVLLR